MNLPKPALSPLSATMRLLPTKTIWTVRMDLSFLSLKAPNESRNISLMFIYHTHNSFLSFVTVFLSLIPIYTAGTSRTHYLHVWHCIAIQQYQCLEINQLFEISFSTLPSLMYIALSEASANTGL